MCYKEKFWMNDAAYLVELKKYKRQQVIISVNHCDIDVTSDFILEYPNHKGKLGLAIFRSLAYEAVEIYLEVRYELSDHKTLNNFDYDIEYEIIMNKFYHFLFKTFELQAVDFLKDNQMLDDVREDIHYLVDNILDELFGPKYQSLLTAQKETLNKLCEEHISEKNL